MSRLSYAQRTVKRRAALDEMGWAGARDQASAPATLLPPRAGGQGAAAKRERKGAMGAQVRLPPDIRTELADKVALQPEVLRWLHVRGVARSALSLGQSVYIQVPCSQWHANNNTTLCDTLVVYVLSV